MKRFIKKTEKRSENAVRKTAGTVILFGVLLGLFVFLMGRIEQGDEIRRTEILEEAVNRDITVCYAEEGQYPENLEVICEKYGLIYDKEKFFIDYQVRGANVRPYVTVIRKERS